jgi:hypothetical protein
MADWVTISSLATAGGTLVLAGATFASVRRPARDQPLLPDPAQRRGVARLRRPPLERRPARPSLAPFPHIGSLTILLFVTAYFYIAAIILLVAIELDELLREDAGSAERAIHELF